jgi:hypothetical protein
MKFAKSDNEKNYQCDQENSNDGRDDGVDELALEEVDGEVDVLVHLAQGRQQEVAADTFNGRIDKHLALVFRRVEVRHPDHVVVPPVLLLALQVLRQRVVPVDVFDVRNRGIVLKWS